MGIKAQPSQQPSSTVRPVANITVHAVRTTLVLVMAEANDQGLHPGVRSSWVDEILELLVQTGGKMTIASDGTTTLKGTTLKGKERDYVLDAWAVQTCRWLWQWNANEERRRKERQQAANQQRVPAAQPHSAAAPSEPEDISADLAAFVV